MKTVEYLCLCLITLLLISCGKDEIDPTVDPAPGEASIVGIQLNNTIRKNQSQQIEVNIHKPTPCHGIKETRVTVSGTTVSYDFILQASENACIQIIAEQVVTVDFEPQVSGKYTLHFLIDGKHYKTEEVVVTD